MVWWAKNVAVVLPCSTKLCGGWQLHERRVCCYHWPCSFLTRKYALFVSTGGLVLSFQGELCRSTCKCCATAQICSDSAFEIVSLFLELFGIFNIFKMLIVLCGRVGEFVRYHLLHPSAMGWFILGIGDGLRRLFFDFRFCIHVTCSWYDPTYQYVPHKAAAEVSKRGNL